VKSARITRRDEQEYVPTDEEAAEIEAGIDELDRGESVTLEEVMREIRGARAAEERNRR
jgi:predicted transcriptional regulator